MNIKIMGNKKYFMGVLVLILVVLGGYYYQNNNDLEMKFDENGVLIMPEKNTLESRVEYAKRLLAVTEKYKEAYYNDDFGGSTPQETLDLFIKALKDGDTALASRYFVIQDREKQLIKLNKLDSEQRADYISMLESGKEISCNDNFDWCELHGLYKNNNILISRFRQIKENSIWKIESL